MGIKERRTKILLALFLMTDVKFEHSHIDEKVQSIFDLTLNQKTKGTLSALIKEGSIEKKSEDTSNEADILNKYKLTDKGFNELCLTFPYFRFMKEKWDGKWRILSYEIPEQKREIRDRLRREVAGWGLGPWHRSFWVTPHPIISELKTLVSGKDEKDYVQAFESEHVFGEREILIEKVWATSTIDKKYRALFKKWHDILSSPHEKTEKMKKIIEEYIFVLKDDPGLPTELIGKNWIGFESFQIYREIRTILMA